MAPRRIGIDTGGTFTDVAALSRGNLSVHKVPSTPADPGRAVLDGLAAARREDEEVDVVHGTTVGINAVLTGTLARTAFVTNEGFEDLIEIGMEALNPVQVSAGGMGDTKKLKREFGDRLAFWGAIDTYQVLPFGTPDEVREEVRRRIADLGPGGGYVICSVHNIQPEVPPENVVAMFDAAHELGRYPLTV